MMCEKLHQLFNRFPRFSYPFQEDAIPSNGIYILFEKGERAHGEFDRIVRVGSHTGQGNLRQRLGEHFFTENKDRSIFRWNIGCALLNRKSDPFLDQWAIEMTTKKDREQYAGKIDLNRISQIEKEVSQIIRTTFTFCVFSVDDRQQRLDLENHLISTINKCCNCGPSNNWLGKHSPDKRIQVSGLWQVKGLDGSEISDEELGFLEQRK